MIDIAQQIFTAIAFLCSMGVILSILLILAEKKLLNYGTCKIDINSGKKEIEVQGGSPLLFNLSDNQIYIPSACGGRGSCGYCKVKIPEGGGQIGPVEEPYLDKQEREEHVRLSCQVKVRNDLSISIPDELFSVRRFTGKVTGKKPLTHDITGLTISLVNPDSIDFTAGQYMQLTSEEYKGRESVMRAYSLSSPPSEKNEIGLIIRKVPEGICTTWVFDHMKEGQEITLTGPHGDFSLSDTKSPMVFIAGGSGMAPIWSMLKHLRENGNERKATYFFGAATQKDLFYTEELSKLETQMNNFKFIPALSNEPEDSNWEGERGLITDVVRKHLPDTTEYEGYLCGSPGMLDACIKVLTEGGMPPENIFYDKF